MARPKSPTSIQANLASQTCQNSTASTFNGTRSLVKVSSAPNGVVRMRMSTRRAQLSSSGMVRKMPGPATREKRPSLSTTTFSHCWAMCKVEKAARPSSTASARVVIVRLPTSASHTPQTRANAAANTASEKMPTPVRDASSGGLLLR